MHILSKFSVNLAEKYNDRYNAEYPDEFAKLHKERILEESILLSIDRVHLECNLLAFYKHLIVLLLGHALLQIVLVEGVPRQMAVALPRRVGLDYHAVRHRNWNSQLFFHAAEEESPSDLEVRVAQRRIPVRVITQVVVIFLLAILSLTANC